MIPSQILVHITAGSTAQDDARYRAQVAAILEFQCASRQLIESKGPADRDPHPLSDAAEHSSVPSTTQHEVSPIVREAFRPAYTTLSSDRHLVPERDGAPKHISNHSDSLESLISVIPDSQPEIAQLVHASPSNAALSPPSQFAPPPKRRRTAPASPNLAQPVSIQPPTPAADQPAASHRTPFQKDSVPGFPRSIEISSSDGTRLDSIHATPSHQIPAIHQTPNLTLPLEIHPPRPPISTAPFTTHITPTLSMLAERLNPSRAYKPSTQSRPLDPLERGYWLVHLAIEPHRDLPNPIPNGTTSPTPNPKEDLRIWPSPLFHAFWSFLSDFVGRDGRAGWGVWCILEDATPAPSTISNTHLSLKVYAWGEVAMHVYLLLFLASERWIRGMGVQWRDASEEVVIQMP
ncbi:hypothetical protein N7491_008036 [Penicillium cf. griseofulvum]|uniref:Uncharacterized protein n=1 Tax=Penicillium cf. griseofulvum TaxID=2972120 RepID=A0A9W9M5S7_9EURO|nr:hypothetical protein N7472_008937 [Penicillium cf. griseofulvum]KAJ5427594.1 hypothetical protein N7491_008036 [Penicillium cf. griseofulvum]KAJ5431791.1 hypothetical protein N7445_008289 [Penicillium cf. griseofulvum]